MRIQRISLFAFLVMVFLALNIAVAGDDCTGLYKGQKLDKARVKTVLETRGPVNLCGTDLSGLDLSGLNLSYADLSGADLSRAKLVKTNLSYAKLQRVFFRWSDLSAANLRGADLQHAVFRDSQLSKANLRQSNLSHANISFANLTGASLQGAKLIQSNLSHSNLTRANLNWADLSGAQLNYAILTNASFEHAKLINTSFKHAKLNHVNFTAAVLSGTDLTLSDLTASDFSQADLKSMIFQPQLGKLPNLIALTTSKNFQHMQFDANYGLPALTELRAAYKFIGVRSMERLITSMIKRKQMHQAWQRGGWGYIESAFSYIFFYITCDYGLSPGRPLRLFLLLILILAIPYRTVLTNPTKHSGISISWTAKRFLHWVRGVHKDKAYLISCSLKKHHYRGAVAKFNEQIRLLRIAMYFSLLSAFRVGPRESLTVSVWITRLQKREYNLKARGWARTLAGAQSLISAYFIVLWALTYFGRPFEW